MLELKGENVFKVRAYDAGARAIRGFPEDLAAALSATGLASRVEIAGGLRRRLEVVEGIALIAASDRPADLFQEFRKAAGIAEVVASDARRRISLNLGEGLRADLDAVPEAEFASALL